MAIVSALIKGFYDLRPIIRYASAARYNVLMKRLSLVAAALVAACGSATSDPTTEPQIIFITPTPTRPLAATATDEPLPFHDLPTITPTALPSQLPPSAIAPPTSAPAPALTTRPPVASAVVVPTGMPTALPVPPTAIPVIQPVSDVASAEQAVIDLTNAQRVANGLPALSGSEIIMQIARARSLDMVTRNYFGHNDPLTGAHIARDAVRASGFGRAGENIYWSGRVSLAEFPAAAVNWFMADPPHRANILGSGYTVIGVGITWNGVGWVLTQDFGGP